MSTVSTRRKITTKTIRARKGKTKITSLTAYDYPTAKLVDAAGVDIVLVGDSLGMVVLGYPDTTHVTVDDMVHHTKAVSRAKPNGLLVADMPFLSFGVTRSDTIVNAGRLIREGGAEAVKQLLAALGWGTNNFWQLRVWVELSWRWAMGAIDRDVA